MAWWRELNRGFLDPRRLALTGGIALATAGLLCVPTMSVALFPRYLGGSAAFAFAIAWALTVSGNLRQSLVPGPLVHAAAVVLASLAVTLVLFASQRKDPLTLIESSTTRHSVAALITLGLVIGAAMAFALALRERQSADRAHHEARERLLEKQVLEARLKLLQAQVEPHFLFNTLASVQRLIAIDPAAAAAMLEDLNQYLRAALPDMRESQSTIGREIDMARAYLNIMQVRLGERLSWHVGVPDALRELPFPPMMLLSLVENAVEHGIGDRARGRIEINASTTPGTLVLSVADDGRGIDTHAPAGVGLTNIRERLAALHGSGAHLSLEEPAAGGLVATLTVPR